jgi:hypothetical protein
MPSLLADTHPQMLCCASTDECATLHRCANIPRRPVGMNVRCTRCRMFSLQCASPADPPNSKTRAELRPSFYATLSPQSVEIETSLHTHPAATAGARAGHHDHERRDDGLLEGPPCQHHRHARPCRLHPRGTGCPAAAGPCVHSSGTCAVASTRTHCQGPPPSRNKCKSALLRPRVRRWSGRCACSTALSPSLTLSPASNRRARPSGGRCAARVNTRVSFCHTRLPVPSCSSYDCALRVLGSFWQLLAPLADAHAHWTCHAAVGGNPVICDPPFRQSKCILSWGSTKVQSPTSKA